jgi:hypothetical protein
MPGLDAGQDCRRVRDGQRDQVLYPVGRLSGLLFTTDIDFAQDAADTMARIAYCATTAGLPGPCSPARLPVRSGHDRVLPGP